MKKFYCSFLLLVSISQLVYCEYDASADKFVSGSGASPAYEPSGHSVDKAVEAAPLLSLDSSGSSGFDDFANVMASMDSIAEKVGIACPADVLFVVDSTGSVHSVFQQYIEYVLKVLEGLTIGEKSDRVGLILYSSEQKRREKIKIGSINDHGKLAERIRNLPFFDGITATGAALRFAEEVLSSRRATTRTSVIVITDGFSYDLIDKSAQQLRGIPNVKVYAVSIGEVFVKSELEMIAGDASRVLFGPTSYGKLVRLIKQCHDEPPPTTPRPTLSTRANIRYITDNLGRTLIPTPSPKLLNRSAAAVAKEIAAAQEGYEGPPADQANTIDVKRNIDDLSKSSSCLYDLVFVFDASGSMTSRFTTQLSMAIRLIDKIVLGPEDTQVAAIKYAGKGKAKTLFGFEKFTDKEDLERTVLSTIFMSGTTYTNEALMKTANILAAPGARPTKAIPVAIVFTDGFSFEDPTKGAATLKEMGAIVYAIGIDNEGQKINRMELENIAGSSSRVFTLSNIKLFEAELDRISNHCLRKKQKSL